MFSVPGIRRPALAGVLLAAGLAGCAAPHVDTAAEDHGAVPVSALAAAPDRPGWLSGDQRRRADQLISVFENSRTELDYAYAQDLGDGRGVTAGRAGFTTSDGDALQVIEAYTARVPGNALAKFVPELRRLAAAGSDDTSGLPKDEYTAAWRGAAGDPAFRAVQDEQVDRRYFGPAMDLADAQGLATALARAELYDAAIQHGTGSDPDGLPALVDRATAKAGRPADAGEKAWLEDFLDIRADDLRRPANQATRAEWAESVDRVECVRRIAASGNYRLDGPFEITAFGSAYTID